MFVGAEINKQISQSQKVELESQHPKVPFLYQCCHLCNNKEANKCWRRSLIDFLDTKSQFVLCLEESLQSELDPIAEEDEDAHDRSLGSNKASHTRKKETLSPNTKKYITGDNANTMTWKDQLIEFIEEQGGSYQD